jgi:hypothetical protein
LNDLEQSVGASHVSSLRSSINEGRFADADSMLAAGEFYNGTTLQRKRICPMVTLSGFASLQPLWRVQLWAATYLLTQNRSGDLRCDIATLAIRGLGSLEAFAERQLSSWADRNMRRARQGAHFASTIAPAATTVAAADR